MGIIVRVEIVARVEIARVEIGLLKSGFYLIDDADEIYDASCVDVMLPTSASLYRGFRYDDLEIDKV